MLAILIAAVAAAAPATPVVLGWQDFELVMKEETKTYDLVYSQWLNGRSGTQIKCELAKEAIGASQSLKHISKKKLALVFDPYLKTKIGGIEYHLTDRQAEDAQEKADDFLSDAEKYKIDCLGGS